MLDKAENPNDPGNFTEHMELKLKHTHNYLSSGIRVKKAQSAEGRSQSVLMMKPGTARPVEVFDTKKDPRAGIFPQHNSPGAFRDELQVLESITFEGFDSLIDVHDLEKQGWQTKSLALTKKRVREIADKFANLSSNAFKQMMSLTCKDKRDFEFHYLIDDENHLTKTAYVNERSGLTLFVQYIYRDSNGRVLKLLHCMFDKGEPFVVNESRIDDYGNIRQISHVGKKGGSNVKNSLERFDDGTVVWTVTDGEKSGTAILRPNGEIKVLGGMLNALNMIAARNLGAEGLNKDGSWDEKFSLSACKPDDHPMQKEYKDSVRNQIYNIIDGSSIPGLKPIFDI